MIIAVLKSGPQQVVAARPGFAGSPSLILHNSYVSMNDKPHGKAGFSRPETPAKDAVGLLIHQLGYVRRRLDAFDERGRT